jgi:Xaa-Pro aminopeptidase
VNGRADRVRAVIEDPLLVTKPVNVNYLTGLDSSNAAVLVEPDRLRVFTDFRYIEKARALELDAVVLRRNLYADLPEHLPKRVEFEANFVTYASWVQLDAGGIDLVPRNELLEGVRAVKEPEELEEIRRAAAITNECFHRLAEQPFVGRSGREIAWWLESLMHELGADGPAFPIIVAGGADGATPHASTSDRPIGPGETVVVDAAARVDGFYSDCTRTFATGELPDELARSYDVCLRAQLAALPAVRAGASGKEVDAVARDLISAEGLGELFGHGLGHGVGRELQEQPWLNPERESVLAAGGVVTVEPGIYHPGLGGIRIEDLVIIGEDEPEILTSFTKELVTVS